MSSPLHDMILQQVFPAVGVLTATFMSFAPYRAVLKASREGTLGDLNPTPWVFMLGNCCGWVAYSFLIHNMYVFLPNGPGFILAIWLNIQAIKLKYENHRSVEMQNSIIAALEGLDTRSWSSKGSKHDLVNLQDVTEMVECVMMEEADILDPETTAPVPVEEVSASETTTTTNTYNSTEPSNWNTPSSSELDNSTSDIKRDLDDGIATVQEAAEMIVDYASFVWDIATQKTPAPASHELMVVGISIFWLIIFTAVAFGQQQIWDESTSVLIIGIAVNGNLIFFYAAPLSKIAVVLETKCSKVIHMPTMLTSLVNATLWFVYGLAVSDYFIAVPNGVGAVLGAVQAIACLIYPRHRHPTSLSGEGGDGISKSNSCVSLTSPEESTPLI